MKRALLLLACLSFGACSSSDSSADEAPAAAAGGAAGSSGAGTGGQGGGGLSGGSGGDAGSGQAGGGQAGGGQAGSGQAGSGQAGSGQAGGDGGQAGGEQGGAGGGGEGGSAAFALSSAGLAEGAVFPAIYTCSGQNVSPPLAWTGAPAGTKGYAMTLTDLSNQLLHWVIWDIPVGVAATPEGVENKAMPADPAGSLQVKSYDSKTFGYLGPCPSGKLHTYQFALHALDTEALPGVTTTSTRPQVAAAILQHSLGQVTLTGMSKASP
jgi:hypothetical protein